MKVYLAVNVPDYTIELWDINGQPVADITRLCSNISFSWKLNDAEQINLTLDLVQFEKLCLKIGSNPRVVLFAGRTEIKIKRNGSYIIAGQVVKTDFTIGIDGSKIEISADGYLNYFLQRFTNLTFTNKDRSQIAWDVINGTQSATYGDFGITQGTLATTSNSDRTCDYDEIKDVITDYTWQAGGANYDFEFTPSKVFNTYLRKGSDKPEVRLTYPQNIADLAVSIDASTLANRIIGIGSGIGDERIESIKSHATSQSKYRTREKKALFNSVLVQATLDNNTQGVLDIYNESLEVPDVTLNNGVVDLNTLETGDAVFVKIENHSYFTGVEGMYRINQINVSLDDNNAETVKLKFYNPKDGGALENA